MVTMADILSSYGQSYIHKYIENILPSHKRVIYDIINCRTEALGAHVYKCREHNQIELRFHSCYNRHCPRCQNEQATQWLANEQKKLINTIYFFLTFTMPKQLRKFARSNQKLFYTLLFSESWRALMTLAQNPKWLGGRIGALAVLHTWTQTMLFHPHTHYLVPAVSVTQDDLIRLPHKKFFVPVKALSPLFRGMFRDALKKEAPELFTQIPGIVWKKKWVVHCKRAGNGLTVLKYLAPYVFRVAISNKRILKLETCPEKSRRNDKVTFAYYDRKLKRTRTMVLPVYQFIARFLQHVLPRGFKKIRHYGFLSSRNKLLLARLQYQFGTVEIKPEQQEELKQPDATDEHCDHDDIDDEINYKIPLCPLCKKAMALVDIIGNGQIDRLKLMVKAAARSP